MRASRSSMPALVKPSRLCVMATDWCACEWYSLLRVSGESGHRPHSFVVLSTCRVLRGHHAITIEIPSSQQRRIAAGKMEELVVDQAGHLIMRLGTSRLLPGNCLAVFLRSVESTPTADCPVTFFCCIGLLVMFRHQALEHALILCNARRDRHDLTRVD